MSGLGDLAAGKGVVVCCGSGGVGKTTVAAAIALESAHLGRRACVVTIDPARRLADALGLDMLSNTPGRIPGDWSGELWALMLDPKGTFDDLVGRYAPSEEQAKTILDNRLYANLSASLSGTHEYMAMEKLYELHEGGDFDVIVVDTPPTRNALDFLDAPRRLTRFLENRIFRVLMTPTRAYLRAVGVATQAMLRTISRVVGAEVVDDAVEFFRSFEGMEQGFKDRAARVTELLADEQTAFVLVASPRGDSIVEATYFAEKLQESGLGIDALVVNRAHPRFGAQPAARATSRGDGPLGVLRDNLADLTLAARHEEVNVSNLTERVQPSPVARIPMLAGDVHDVAGLEGLRKHLF